MTRGRQKVKDAKMSVKGESDECTWMSLLDTMRSEHVRSVAQACVDQLCVEEIHQYIFIVLFFPSMCGDLFSFACYNRRRIADWTIFLTPSTRTLRVMKELNTVRDWGETIHHLRKKSREGGIKKNGPIVSIEVRSATERIL